MTFQVSYVNSVLLQFGIRALDGLSQQVKALDVLPPNKDLIFVVELAFQNKILKKCLPL